MSCINFGLTFKERQNPRLYSIIFIKYETKHLQFHAANTHVTKRNEYRHCAHCRAIEFLMFKIPFSGIKTITEEMNASYISNKRVGLENSLVNCNVLHNIKIQPLH